jgi:DNA-binding NtrC family response regulator
VRSILFVDDESGVLDDMRAALLPLGGRYSMVFADSGRAALKRLALRRFDAVVTDMRMPGMDGSALLAAVQAQHPTTIRIVLSGIGELAVVQAASTAHLFLAKPCGAAELMTTIDRACRQGAADRQLPGVPRGPRRHERGEGRRCLHGRAAARHRQARPRTSQRTRRGSRLPPRPLGAA